MRISCFYAKTHFGELLLSAPLNIGSLLGTPHPHPPGCSVGDKGAHMKALVRIPLGKGRYLAIFKNSILIEYYDEYKMTGIHVII